MKENKYDNREFFERYSHMPRSVEGLQAAGEWHELKKMLPGFQGKRVLDLGCGFGWHCRYAAEQGALEVVGIDLSENMLKKAREMTGSPVVTYQRMSIEDYDYPKEYFDMVISSLAFHYCKDFSGIAAKVNRCLKNGGDFVFSVEHPIFTAYGTQQWYCDSLGNKLHWPVDRYFDEGKRTADFLGEKVAKYHKTLTTYLNPLLINGFQITRIIEPKPEEHMLAQMPDELRRPMMLLVSAHKK